MSNSLITGTNGAIANVPEYARGDSGLGDLGGESWPRLTFKGSRFRISKGGDETVLDTVRLQVIILAASPTVSRICYAGAYSEAEGTGERPACASADGEHPLPTVAQPFSDRCATCPKNEKGSSIGDDGGKRKACSYFHRLVLKLVDYPDMDPVVAEIKAMSLFGTSYPDQNLVNFRHFADRLNQHQTVAHAVITELSFDTDSSVPKILFQPVAYVTEDEFTKVINPLHTDAEILKMADTTTIRTGNDGDTGAGTSGFRDKLVDAAKPAHAQIAPPAETVEPPEPSLEDQLSDALADEDYTTAGVLKGLIEARDAQVNDEPATGGNSLENQMAEAVANGDYARAAEIKAEIAAYHASKEQKPAEKPNPVPAPEATKEQAELEALQKQIADLKAKTAVPAPTPPAETQVNKHGVHWNPVFHATASNGEGILNTDGHWRARRGITPELAAMVKLPTAEGIAKPEVKKEEAPPAEESPEAKTKFDADLDDALAEFDE